MAATNIETTYREWIASCNAGASDFTAFLHSKFEQDKKSFTPESWAEDHAETRKTLGPVTTDVDYVMVDEEQQLIATRLSVKCTPQKPWMGITPAGQHVSFAEMHFVWFTDGKISRLDTILDDAAIAKQLADPQATYEFCSAKEVTPSSTPLSPSDLEKVYDEFVEAINSRTMKEKFPQQIHDSIYQNEREFSREGFIKAMEGIMFCMPDVRATIRTKIVDSKAQRIIVQLELAGTIEKPIAGCEPTGRPVAFNEHVMYEWVDGRIARNWVLLDFGLMSKQLKGEA